MTLELFADRESVLMRQIDIQQNQVWEACTNLFLRLSAASYTDRDEAFERENLVQKHALGMVIFNNQNSVIHVDRRF